MKNFRFVILVLSFFIIYSCSKDKLIPVGTVDCSTITYSGTIQEIISTNCNSAGCHGNNSSNGDFTTYANLKPFADNGKIQDQVIDTQEMPIGRELTSEQLGQIQCWLDAGAPDN